MQNEHDSPIQRMVSGGLPLCAALVVVQSLCWLLVERAALYDAFQYDIDSEKLARLVAQLHERFCNLPSHVFQRLLGNHSDRQYQHHLVPL